MMGFHHFVFLRSRRTTDPRVLFQRHISSNYAKTHKTIMEPGGRRRTSLIDGHLPSLTRWWFIWSNLAQLETWPEDHHFEKTQGPDQLVPPWCIFV
ncbi:hypothetical protein GDO81_018317 [Engystomops pustulosus]|uniref:Uncharacterized protein n=1 Tax=Engystomops pustulosus TaxID=76066 RepID=A0AAV7AAA8_ENGPU|nr:hypothetical protein GDO81_018317 [Engystomops pustulosus]